jgi:hypothetical protein
VDCSLCFVLDFSFTSRFGSDYLMHLIGRRKARRLCCRVWDVTLKPVGDLKTFYRDDADGDNVDDVELYCDRSSNSYSNSSSSTKSHDGSTKKTGFLRGFFRRSSGNSSSRHRSASTSDRSTSDRSGSVNNVLGGVGGGSAIGAAASASASALVSTSAVVASAAAAAAAAVDVFAAPFDFCWESRLASHFDGTGGVW